MNERAPIRAGAGIPPPNVVDQIRSSNDAWHRRDLEASLAPYTEDIEWDTTEAFPDGRVYSGMPAFRAYAEEVLERWEDHRMEIQEILVVNGQLHRCRALPDVGPLALGHPDRCSLGSREFDSPASPVSVRTRA